MSWLWQFHCMRGIYFLVLYAIRFLYTLISYINTNTQNSVCNAFGITNFLFQEECVIALKNGDFISEEINNIEEVAKMVVEDALSSETDVSGNTWGIDSSLVEDNSCNEDNSDSKNKTSNDKRKNFLRLAEARMEKTLKSISLLGNLADKSSYEYADEEVEMIFSILEYMIAEVRSEFISKKKEIKFSFKG